MVGKLRNGISVKESYLELKESGLAVTPFDVFSAMHRNMKECSNPGEMLPYVDKVMNLVHLDLSEYRWKRPAEGTFIFKLMVENWELVRLLERYKEYAGSVDSKDGERWMEFVLALRGYEPHLQILENILFPELEKTDKVFEGLSMLWGMHDNARSLLRQASMLFSNDSGNVRDFNEMIGRLFFMFHGLVKKQELILFPIAMERLDGESMERMSGQSVQWGRNMKEVDVMFEEQPESNKDQEKDKLGMIMKALPFDLTFVNEKDEVAFFSEGERIFPRSASVIGRKVQNCHPPKSLDAVESILRKFREKKSSLEEFWIDHHGKKILIRYVAVRDRDGEYLGTLEITQDITGIRKLYGEKRLL